MSNIKNATTKSVIKDSKPFPLVTITYLERTGEAAIVENYGIHGSAPTGTPCLMFTVGNDEANRMIIPLSANVRTKNFVEGEFECGNYVVGSTIKFDSLGNIIVTSINDVTVNSGNDVTVNSANEINITSGTSMNIISTGGTINVTGNISVTGSMTVTGDIISDTISLQNHVHSGVTTGGSNTGVPV